ncbi:MAG: cytochrome-c oxidase, cbb3-type subunit III [Gammaproteobacteria bacterium]|jgi:cytochrome c oxidase cbb3-type subunit 3|nr:cytochrome-c oxidase, cbb3-type subunit III [Gammaproteobacteria bacterium]
MADFTSSFWNWFIIIPTIGGIIACFLLIRWLSTAIKPEEQGKEMGHVWDDDLVELNNPLPRWWLNMFYITLYFSIGYLALYPGLGTFKGFLGWTSTGQYEREIDIADAKYGPLFKKFQEMPIVAVAADPEARRMGERLFVNYCATCHGSDARGARGFPNLRDNDWLYGGGPDVIQQTILDGRNGVMPAWADALGGDAGVADVTEFVFSLSGRDVDQAAAARGGEKYQMLCVACHGADGTGNQALGAPNLTDSIWLYGGSSKQVMETIANGRVGVMPPHRDFLGEDKVHLLAAYVYSLSTGQEALEE